MIITKIITKINVPMNYFVIIPARMVLVDKNTIDTEIKAKRNRMISELISPSELRKRKR